MFSMAVWRGTIAGPLHWRAGWQTGSLTRPIALNAYFCQENCPLVNYPNEAMSVKCHGRNRWQRHLAGVGNRQSFQATIKLLCDLLHRADPLRQMARREHENRII